MRYVTATQGKCDSICIGRQGENKVVTVQFDVSGWQEMYGSGSFSLLHQRSADMSAYPCVITSDTNTVSWVITSTDVFYVGNGKAQLLYIVDDKVAKSVVFTTNTLQSLNAGDVPDPEPEWITDVVNAGLDAEAYAIGERNGDPVSEDDPAYHNNAKWFAEMPTDKIFWVTYGQTTFAQIQQALDNKQFPVIKRTTTTDEYFVLSSYKSGSNGYFLFTGKVDGTSHTISNIKVTLNGSTTLWTPTQAIFPILFGDSGDKRYVVGATNGTQEAIEFDNIPTNNSKKLLTSGDVYTAIEKIGQLLISKGLITQAEWDAR